MGWTAALLARLGGVEATLPAQRQAAVAAECVLTVAAVRAQSLYERKLSGDDVATEAVDLLTVLTLAGQLQNAAETP